MSLRDGIRTRNPWALATGALWTLDGSAAANADRHDRRRWHLGRSTAAEIVYFGWSLADREPREGLFAAHPSTGRIRPISRDSGAEAVSDRAPAWSPNRRLLAVQRSTDADPKARLYLLDARTGELARHLVPGAGPEWYDGRTLLFLRDGYRVDGDGVDHTWTDVYAVDLTSLAVTRLTDLEVLGGAIDTMSWHPMRGLAIGYESRHAMGSATRHQVVRVRAPRIAAALHGGPKVTGADMTCILRNATGPHWSPDGNRLAHVRLTRIQPLDADRWGAGTLLAEDVAVRDCLTHNTIALTTDGAQEPGRGGSCPVFSPDGRHVAFTRGDGADWQEIWVSPSTAGSPQRLTDEGRGRFNGGLAW